MIGIDTNILARYYIEDEADQEALHQHYAARRLIESQERLMVAKSVVLEFEWVMRGYYQFSRDEVQRVLHHLCAMNNLEIEDRSHVEQAIRLSASGMDFADALHHASYGNCIRMATFDDRKFARRMNRAGVSPKVFVPQ